TAGAAARQAIGNPDLRPERTAEFETGFDTELFGGRGQLEATYYNRLSTDAIISRPLPSSVGITSRLENIGTVRNYGYEGLLSARLLETRFTAVDVSLNGAIMNNRLEKLTASDLTFVGSANPS